jgi:hypothetical protein
MCPFCSMLDGSLNLGSGTKWLLLAILLALWVASSVY